ncbi:hypothetical protein SLA2020_528400 [Shorea laevis]
MGEPQNPSPLSLTSLQGNKIWFIIHSPQSSSISTTPYLDSGLSVFIMVKQKETVKLSSQGQRTYLCCCGANLTIIRSSCLLVITQLHMNLKGQVVPVVLVVPSLWYPPLVFTRFANWLRNPRAVYRMNVTVIDRQDPFEISVANHQIILK